MNLKYKQWIDGFIGRALASVNVVLVRGVGLVLRRNHSIEKAPDHILVIKMLGIGSVLMAMDSLHSLKLKYPGARFVLMCGKGVAAGIAPLNFFDEIWVHDDKNIFRLMSSGFRLLSKTWQLKKLWVLDLEVYSVLTTLFSAWTMAINRFGFQLNKVHFRNYLNTHNIYFNQFVPVQENYFALVNVMGVQKISNYLIPLKNSNSGEIKNTIAINNTCSELGGNLRKLETPKLVQMIEHICKNYTYELVLTGAPIDFEENEKIIQLLSSAAKLKTKNIAGKMSFQAYYHFLSQHCIAMISIDSAPLHIATKLGIPSFSIWGPINPMQRIQKDTNIKQHFLYLNKPCSPCIHLSDIVPCNGNNICMKDYSADHLCQEFDLFIESLKHD
jgi:ADP-heptose:LPS heptosyltransferase